MEAESEANPIHQYDTGLLLGTPIQLFTTRIMGGGVDTQQGRQYGIASDGMFVINTELPGPMGPITLIQNWDPQAQK